MSIWSPSKFNFGTIFKRTPLWKYSGAGDNNVNIGIQNQATINQGGGGVITDPKFGTSHKRNSKRVVVPAGLAIQIYWKNSMTIRVAIRNVLNNPAVFDNTSAVSLTHYGNALQGAVGAEPTAGESDIFDSDDDIWVFSTLGTTLVMDEETK